MPVSTEEQIIHTKVIGVMSENRQTLLLAMYNNPESVIELVVENDIVTLLIEIDSSPVKHILGHIKEKYMPFLQNKSTRIKQWMITGGKQMPEYGNRCQALGLNITINYN